MNQVRCAIYCRKSVEKGLDMEFNTLDAQREAAEAYIESQKANGWVCLPEHYDDGGFSGGNLNRPALQKLLADCEAGKIDVIVVYKIDRLSRSLCDFADLSRSFEKWNVAFVSVTQVKQMLLCVLAAVILSVVAGTALHRIRRADSDKERESILSAMKKCSSKADKALNEAETQLDMNFASGSALAAVEPYLALSAEYRLRRLKTTEERTALLQQLIDLTDSLRRMYDASLEGTGSIEPMLRHLRGEHLIRRQAKIWLLPDAEYQDWMRLADSKLELDGTMIQLKNGIGEFRAERYDDEYELEVSIEPDRWFRYQGNIYAVVVEDMEGSLNSDFLRLHLCRLGKIGILHRVMELETFYLDRIEFNGGTLVLTGDKTHGGGDYRKEIAIPE